jgi:toxin ParE1/3/4
VTRLVVSDTARADLRAIRNYTEREWGPSRRDQYLAAIESRLKLLKKRPELAAIRSDLPTGFRSIAIGRHLIFYRYENQTVLIVRVLHQQMDVRLHL